MTTLAKIRAEIKKYTPKQEPCDVVSRQAVIGEFKDMYKAAERWSQDATEDDIKARADAVMATLIEQKLRVEALPSVRPQEQTGHWIPVSERLPEDEQEILFSTKTGRVHSGKYHDDNSANPWYSHRDKCRAWNNVVSAWMPLPTPYEPQESEDKE